MDLEPHDERRLRASDADRERVVALLRRHHADGRLDLEELKDRVGRAYAAKTVDELDDLLGDLPPEAPLDPAPLAPPARREHARRNFYRSLASYVLVNAFLTVIWLAGGRGYFWPVWVMIGWGFGVAWQAVHVFVPGDDGRDRDRRRDRRR
jgi:Domain of unknown function (DUF1707)/2TM domain